MINIYCISGLGADRRIFDNLKIKDVNLVHIKWPVHSKTDAMSSYAVKVSEIIKEDNPVIMGVSFGGMLAVEIAKVRPVKRAILISSAKDIRERPSLPYLIKHIVTTGLIPSFMYKIPNPVLYALFGVESRRDRKVLREIVLDSDAELIKWAVNAIITWPNTIVPGGIVHIHGKKDRLIRPRNIKANYWIEDGGHMMIYNRADQISRIIEQELEGL